MIPDCKLSDLTHHWPSDRQQAAVVAAVVYLQRERDVGGLVLDHDADSGSVYWPADFTYAKFVYVGRVSPENPHAPHYLTSPQTAQELSFMRFTQ